MRLKVFVGGDFLLWRCVLWITTTKKKLRTLFEKRTWYPGVDLQKTTQSRHGTWYPGVDLQKTTQSRHVVNDICELGRGQVHFLLNDTSELGRDHVHFLQCVCVDDDVNEIEIASIRRSLLCYVWDCKRLHEQFGLKAPPWAMLLSRWKGS